MRIVPSSGGWTPASTLTSVDLPAPFSPTIAWISPALSSRSTPWSTSTPTKLFRIPCIWSRGAVSDIHPASGGGRCEHGLGHARGAHAVAEPWQAVGLLARDRRVRVRHERVEAVEVALRVADRHDRVARRRRAEVRGVAPHLLGPIATPDPQGLGALLLEPHAGRLAGHLDVEVVLAPRRDLADEQRAEHARGSAEHHGREVLGGDRAPPVAVAVGRGLERARGGVTRPLGH